MSKRITSEQIAKAKQYFRDGYSIPECCLMANMSRASFNKYCKEAVNIWLDEHTQAEQDRLAAQNQAQITKLSYDEFVSYVEFELDNCADDIVYLKELYYQLKEDAKDEYRKLIRLRELYEDRLKRIGKPKASTSKLKAIGQTIEDYKAKYDIDIPTPKAYRGRWKTDTDKRVAEHLAYWLCANYLGKSHKEAIALTKLTKSELDEWLKLLPHK